MRIGRGVLVTVIGASGAGKDTLIDHAREVLESKPGFLFVRRCITRLAQDGGEAHDSMSEMDFLELESAGGFAVTWTAHGLHYGVPASARRHVHEGGIAVLNGSRKALPAIAAAFPGMLAVEIVASRQTRAHRLATRGRESASEILARLDREVPDAFRTDVARTISNDGSVAEAGKELADWLSELASLPEVSS